MENKQTQTYRHLNIVSLKNVSNWSSSSILRNKLLYRPDLRLVKIRDLIIRHRDRIIIKNEEKYRRVTIRTHNKGVRQRDEVIGKSIGTKNQFKIKGGQFIMSKIDARNGAFGIVPPDLEGAVVTQDFLPYDINTDLVLPQFFFLLTYSEDFRNLCQQASSGTTGRQRIDENLFLDFEVPLPEMMEQKSIVKKYEAKISLSQEQDKEALKLEKRIETFILEQLNINSITSQKEKKSFQIYNYKNFKRWDVFSKDISFYKILKQSTFELKELGEAFDFVRRGWSKKNSSNEFINYIELGSIDLMKGVKSYKRIKALKAPSRASKIVKSGDLLIGTTRPYLKRFALISDKFDNFICSSGFSVIKESKEKYNLNFLKYYLASEIGLEQLKNNMTGALYPAITETKLKSILIPFPPVKIQNKIAQGIENLHSEIINNKLKSKKNKSEAIQTFEQSIFKTATNETTFHQN